MNSRGLADYLVDHDDAAALYNTSAEDGIFPNVANNMHEIQAPSYVPEFNYNDNTPLVYSWFPVVPGFYDDGYNNLHNFSYINGKLDASDASDVDAAKVDEAQQQQLKAVKVEEKTCVKIETTTTTTTSVNFHALENSCNAMDLNLTCQEQSQSLVSCDLSFNGKIEKLKESSARDDEVDEAQLNEEEERIRNESFEMLKKEDSQQMLILNEKSPEANVKENSDSEASERKSPEQQSADDEPEKTTSTVSDDVSQACAPEMPLKSPKTRDRIILSKLKAANCRIVPPPSVTDCTISLTDMLTLYHRNTNKSSETFERVETDSLFVPSHSSTVGRDFVEWPAVTSICALDVTYNRNEAAETIEEERLKFCDRYVGKETASSFDFKISHESAKKMSEKMK